MKRLLNWLDDRTGYRSMTNAMLFEYIPGGARWRYAWGSTLVFTFFVQTITGFFLWMSYSPSAQTAWESVYYIQHHLLGEHCCAESIILLRRQ
jgi:ubiquinol-cytochrome c reductase cytochrome b subunit